MDWTPDDARKWALAKHRSIGQRRPYSDEPYEAHLAEVVELIRSVPHTARMEAGGWLHHVEDDIPGVTAQMVAREFGWAVAVLVDALSDHEKGLDTRQHRTAAKRARIARADWETQTVCVSAVISNVRTIAQHSPEFARVYVPEKAALIEVLTKADPTLLALARKTIADTTSYLDSLAVPA